MDVGACVWALGMPRFTDAGVSSAPLERQRYFTCTPSAEEIGDHTSTGCMQPIWHI